MWGSHGLPICEAVKSGRSLPAIWKKVLPPSSRLKSKPRKQEAGTYASYFFLLGFFEESLKMETTLSAKTPVNFY
jgi:hypothetical protein